MRERTFRIAAGGLLAFLAAVQISSLVGETQTWDEGIHLTAGFAYLKTGHYDLSPEHPPLGRILCALPLLFENLILEPASFRPPAPQAGFHFLYRNRLAPEWILTSARLMMIGVTLTFGAFLAWWTRRRFSSSAALTALALFCFDPNITAHGRYVTTDLIASFLILASVALWIDCVDAPSLGRIAAAGIALGAALASKNSALFLVGVLPLIGLARRRTLAVAGLLGVAAVTLAIVYLPELAHGRMSYVEGVRSLLNQNDVGEPGYLLGQISNHGWWYYFPVAFAVKTPVGTMLAFALAAVAIWRVNDQRFAIAALALVAGAYFAACLMSHITIGLRHLLPMYAFLFVLAGVALAAWPKAAVLCVAVLAIESIAIYPYYLAFFNVAAGGPKNGPRFLVDSNIDWGQDAARLGSYIARHRLDRVCLSYFGNADLLRSGVEFIPLPKRREEADCVAAVSVTALRGLYGDPRDTAWLLQREPDARIGYSIYIYDLRRTR